MRGAFLTWLGWEVMEGSVRGNTQQRPEGREGDGPGGAERTSV